jgi:hypothetical protein
MIRRVGRLSAEFAGEYGARLSRRISAALLAALAALWLTGALWLALHYFWAQPDEFGVVRHPLESPTVLAHGVMALVVLFLLGWFAGRHAGAASSGRRMASGWLLTLLLAVLVVAGCAQLFATSAALQSTLAVVHWVLGLALLLPVLVHARRASAASRDRAAHHEQRGPGPPPHRHGGRRGAGRRHSVRS